MSRLAHQVAVASPHVSSEVVDVDALPELAAKHRVSSVPKTLVGGAGRALEHLGTLTEAALVDAVLGSLD